MSVAAAVGPDGLLVLNADDPQLRRQAAQLQQRFGQVPPLGWFSTAIEGDGIENFAAPGASTCNPRQGRLHVHHRGMHFDLGLIADMPLSMGGVAGYNIANLAAAALGAIALGVDAATIAGVLARFGTRLADNPGRLMRFDVGGVKIGRASCRERV